jgi:hypothetical protein
VSREIPQLNIKSNKVLTLQIMSQNIPWISKDIAKTAAATLVMTKYFLTEEFTRYLICLKIGLQLHLGKML